MTTTEETMMTDHTEMQIPDDVMQQARGYVSGYLHSLGSYQDADAVFNGTRDHWAEVQCVARAILAERERCARIADRNDMSAWGIAREIRSVDK